MPRARRCMSGADISGAQDGSTGGYLLRPGIPVTKRTTVNVAVTMGADKDAHAVHSSYPAGS